MITKLEERERYGTTVTTYETESGAFGRKYWKIGRECGWDSEEARKILDEGESVKQLTVGDVIEFLSSLPRIFRLCMLTLRKGLFRYQTLIRSSNLISRKTDTMTNQGTMLSFIKR